MCMGGCMCIKASCEPGLSTCCPAVASSKVVGCALELPLPPAWARVRVSVRVRVRARVRVRGER